MSKDMKAALRRARLRELTRDAERPRDPEAPEKDAGYYDPEGQAAPAVTSAAGSSRIYFHVLELSDEERTGLENIAGRYTYAQELLDGVEEDGRISESAVWNARDALEDDTGRAWPSTLPLAGPGLAKKIGKLFEEAV